MPERPDYDAYTDFCGSRGALADALARQVLATTAPWLAGDPQDLDVLDVGSGYGGTALALAARCRSVVGMEPARGLYEDAVAAAGREPGPARDVRFVNSGIGDLEDVDAFDLVVLDNVYEHLADQPDALRRIERALRPGGVLYLLVPNKLWPIEAHYRLPFLSWLPLRAANHYLRLSRRGRDYKDASYAPTYWGLRAALDRLPALRYRFVLPGDPAATKAGSPVHYRIGLRLLARWPALWAVSKALLVVAVKQPASSDR